MKITEIKTQKLSTIVSNFLICHNCHFVDNDHERSIVGHPCSICGIPSRSGRIYFGTSVHSLIDLMQ
jgi:hypothetical protein